MSPFFVLLMWSLSGAVISVLAARPEESRFAWWPLGVIFGPMWLFVAAELRTSCAGSDQVRLQKRVL